MRRLTATLILALFSADITTPGLMRAGEPSARPPGPGQSSGQTGQQPAQFDPIWNKTGERVPREVTDKEKESPKTWCGNHTEVRSPVAAGYLDRWESVVTYEDFKTGTKTTIRRTETRPHHVLPPPGTSPVADHDIIWEITTEGPRQPTRYIRYELNSTLPRQLRIERLDERSQGVRDVIDSDFSSPPRPGRRGSLEPSLISRSLANVSYRYSDVDSPAPIILAATQQRPSEPSLQTQAKPEPTVMNVKIVSYGDPPAEVFIHMDPGPQSTPEQIATGTPATTWTPEDGQGPRTHTGTPTGIPVIFYPPGTTATGSPSGTPPVTGIPGTIGIPITPGTTIHVGWGWAHASIPSKLVGGCSEGQTGSGTRASAPPQTASVPQASGTPTSTVAPKQACVWVTVPRPDVPDFESMVRGKESEADKIMTANLQSRSPGSRSCPETRSMSPSNVAPKRASVDSSVPPVYRSSDFRLTLGTVHARSRQSSAGLSTPLNQIALASDVPPTVRSSQGPFPRTNFGQHKTDDVLIPEVNRVREIQNQMTANSGRDDLLQKEGWEKFQEAVRRATGYIRICNKEFFEQAIEEILAIHRRLERRKADLESIRDQLHEEFKRRFSHAVGEINQAAEQSTGGAVGTAAGGSAAIGTLGIVLELLLKVEFPIGAFLDLAHFLYECHHLGHVNAVLKYDAPRVLDRLEIMNDLTVLIKQYEMRLEADRELIDELSKAYDEHKCRKCVPPGTGTTQVPGTTPRTGAR